MAITAAMVKQLREKTGAGMMDCKNALSEVDGNMDEAIELLRKKGVMKAEKKADRIAAEGLCDCLIDGSTAAVVEVNSETDFVAKNDDFKQFVSSVAKQALATSASDIDSFLADKWNEDSTKTVKEALTDKVAVIGENLSIRRLWLPMARYWYHTFMEVAGLPYFSRPRLMIMTEFVRLFPILPCRLPL